MTDNDFPPGFWNPDDWPEPDKPFTCPVCFAPVALIAKCVKCGAESCEACLPCCECHGKNQDIDDDPADEWK